MLRSHLCDYSDVYTLDKGTSTLANTAAQSQANSGSNKQSAPFTNCISKINNI